VGRNKNLKKEERGEIVHHAWLAEDVQVHQLQGDLVSGEQPQVEGPGTWRLKGGKPSYYRRKNRGGELKVGKSGAVTRKQQPGP